ncbi:hypothetical protein [Vogesella indigofera]|uniref:hypothetical protein n=1 Tax=Vogesella indigofera TaxID=45465 RepID=UPI00234F504C|nr:hypothetical protein [Vogesella indigofera]MDC7706557.1 hypothetical protein [Vogesella indigofera]
MGFFSSLVEGFFDTVKAVGKAIVEVAAPAVSYVVENAQRLVKAVWQAVENEYRDPPKDELERLEQDLNEVNERIQRLRERHLSRKYLTDSEQREWEHLKAQRQHLTNDILALDKVCHAEEIATAADDYESLIITDHESHILQYHVGQSTQNKSCPRCGRPMMLQWQQSLQVAYRKDFFWGCSGFTFNQCRHAEPMSTSDFNIFLNTKRSEFELTPEELAEFTFQKSPTRVAEAMRDIKSKLAQRKQGVNEYRCPFHMEKLILREKRKFNGLADQFFLGCPRWQYDNNGCNYIVKLKSAAQLSAVLNASGENGVVAVLEGGVIKKK